MITPVWSLYHLFHYEDVINIAPVAIILFYQGNHWVDDYDILIAERLTQNAMKRPQTDGEMSSMIILFEFRRGPKNMLNLEHVLPDRLHHHQSSTTADQKQQSCLTIISVKLFNFLKVLSL